MNNNNTPDLIRSLIIYAVCIPLAVCLGYSLAAESEVSQSGSGWAWNIIALFKANPVAWGSLVLVMSAPLLLRWHHFLLIATWNLGLTLYFLPGSPPIWLLMATLSLGISVLHRTINNRAQFLSAPIITKPLVFFLAVVLFTAKLTGGIGLHSLGNDTAGGKNYVLLLMGILGYFALTAQRIPPNQVWLYISLFFLGGCVNFIGDLAPYLPSSLSFLFAFFPVTGYDMENKPGIVDFHARFAGVASLGMAGFLFMLARYGPRGIFLSGRLWRPVLFVLFAILIFFGGFRSAIIICGSVFLIQCYLERLHQTKVFPAFIFAGVVMAALLIPFASKLPFTFQRSLAFLPLHLNQDARRDAESTKEWRLGIWKDALQTVPQYLLLGKGYALSQSELAMASSQNFNYTSDFQSVDIVGNYHSGPLSVVIPFGIWGVIALFWFWIASVRALYLNYRYGDPGVRTINIFLLAYFIAKIFLFLIIFGGLYGDMYYFTSMVGLSVSINGGIRRIAVAPVSAANKVGAAPPARPRFQPFYQR